MGLTVSILRDPLGDGTNGGVSSTPIRACVVNIPGPFEPDDRHPALILIDRGRYGKVLYPAHKKDGRWTQLTPSDKVGPMFGGNFAYSSDSRFGDAVGFYGAVPIHDRFETQKEYDFLSR